MNHPDDIRPFPIQGGVVGRNDYRPSQIPWWLAEEAYKVYSRREGAGQSLERLAERGGFGREELLNLLRTPDAPPPATAKHKET
jgi:hypothetical protein